MTFRPGYAVATVMLFAVEISIALWMHDRLIRPYVGDSLAVVLAYCGLRTMAPLAVVPAARTALAIAFAIELSQWFHLLDALGLGESELARFIFGSGFDPKDFLAYAAGALLVLTVERFRGSL